MRGNRHVRNLERIQLGNRLGVNRLVRMVSPLPFSCLQGISHGRGDQEIQLNTKRFRLWWMQGELAIDSTRLDKTDI